MNSLHAKSPCCRAGIRRFGERRRQCTTCKKTWRVRKKRRGRKQIRAGSVLALQYLRHELPSLYARARARNYAADRLERRLIASRDYFLTHTAWPALPEGPLIACADAMVRQVDRVVYTTYFILLRPITGDEAVMLEPLTLPGKETPEGWYRAFDRVPTHASARIKALVCDAHVGLVSVSLRHGWLLQWCNFHIIAAMQGRRSRFAASRHRRLGAHLYQLTCRILVEKDVNAMMRLLSEIESIGWETSSKQLRKIISGFVNHAERYRTYLTHPELCLPRTNNTCETLIGEFQKLAHRMRGWNNIESLKSWLAAYIKYKKTISCKPSCQPN